MKTKSLSVVMIVAIGCMTIPLSAQPQLFEESVYEQEQWDRVSARYIVSPYNEQPERLLVATLFMRDVVRNDAIAIQTNNNADPHLLLVLRELHDLPNIATVTTITMQPTNGVAAEWRFIIRNRTSATTPRPLDVLLAFRSVWDLEDLVFLEPLITFATTVRHLPDATISLAYVRAFGTMTGQDFPYEGTLTKETTGPDFMLRAVVQAMGTSGAPLIISLKESPQYLTMRVEEQHDNGVHLLPLTDALERVDALLSHLRGGVRSTKYLFLDPWRQQSSWNAIASKEDLQSFLSQQ